MAITVSDILTVAAPTAMRQLQKPYELGPVIEDEHGYRVALFNANPWDMVSIKWSHKDEIALTTERAKIEFCRSLLVDAVITLDFVLERRQAQDDGVIDVDFGEYDE